MMQVWIAGVVSAAVGILVGYLLRNLSAGSERALLDGRNRELTDTLNATSNQLTQRDGQILDLARQNSKLESDLANEKGNGERLTQQFKLLANEILKENSKTFSEGSQKDLGNLLTPLRQQIEDFRKKVEETQVDSKTSVAKMEGLIGNLGNLNQQLAEEAKNLSTALRGSAKAQGDWGEFILRDLLEKAGLREGDQYSFQETFTGLENDDNGRTKSARTDVIVFLPGGAQPGDRFKGLSHGLHRLCKCSDRRRSQCCAQAPSGQRAGSRGRPGARPAIIVFPVLKLPISWCCLCPLSRRSYSPFRMTLRSGPTPIKQGILLVGPTTLLYIIRIVNVLWQQELQARSVKDVMNRGSELYDKFVNFVADLEAVGKSLRAADQNYSSAMKKLSEGRGNLVRQVEMLKELGIRTGKSLPQNLLDSAAVEEPGLALAASADDNGQTDS